MIEPLVSIIVPVYNCSMNIEKIFRNLSYQSYHNIEFIIVDDGSSDTTLQKCNQMKQQDQRYIIISKKNGGVSSARNAGLERANGQYIIFIDADDEVDKNYVRSLINYIDDSDIAIANIEVVSEKNDILYRYLAQNEIDGCRLNLNTWSVWGKLFRAEVIKQVRFDEKIHIAEDMNFICECIKLNHPKVVACEEATYYYRNNTESAMHSQYSVDFFIGLKSEEYCYELLKDDSYINIDNCRIITNGAYQMLTRFFELNSKERRYYYSDYLETRRIVFSHFKYVFVNKERTTKKIVILLAIFMPHILFLYKKFRK